METTGVTPESHLSGKRAGGQTYLQGDAAVGDLHLQVDLDDQITGLRPLHTETSVNNQQTGNSQVFASQFTCPWMDFCPLTTQSHTTLTKPTFYRTNRLTRSSAISYPAHMTSEHPTTLEM